MKRSLQLPSLQFALALCLMLVEVMANCLPGCLKCGDDNKCVQCDFTNFYTLVENDCQKLNITTACEQIDPLGNCLFCGNNQTLIDSKCIGIVPESPIPGCVSYLSKSACQTCGSSYVLQEGFCLPSRALITDCEILLNNGTNCQKCRQGTILSADRKVCLKPPNSPNCLSYSIVGCSQCKAGFFRTAQKYQIDIKRSADQNQKLSIETLTRFINLMQDGGGYSSEGMCAKTTIDNCVEFSDFSNCVACSPGFYLTSDNTCEIFPSEPIPFCEIYTNSTTCSKCENKYYMSDFNKCKPVIEIVNCLKYNGDTDKACLLCESKYYSDISSCKQRVVSLDMPACEIFDSSADKCAVCRSGFETNFDGSQCLEEAPNCASYLKSASQFNCTSCKKYYYPDNGVCLTSDSENCKTASGKESCAECENGFYLNGTTCSPHPLKSVLNCTTTNSFLMNSCMACAPTSVKVPLDGMCMPVQTPIANCLVYSSATTCSECDPKVSFPKNGICPGVYIENCSEYNSAQEYSCKTCKVSYIRNTVFIPYPRASANNTCVSGDPNVIENCLQYDIRNSAEFCTTCMNKYYPFDMPSANLLYCVPKNFYLLPPQQEKLADCIVFSPKTGRCIACTGSKVIGVDGLCTTQCKNGEFLYSVSHDLTNSTDVGFKSFMECSTVNPAMPSTIFSPVPLSCYLVADSSTETEVLCGGCGLNNVGLIDWSKDLSKSRLLSYFPVSDIINYSYFNRITAFHGCVSNQGTYSGLTTTTSTRVVMLEGNQVSSLENCRVVSKVGSSDRHGCVACRLGFSGTIVKDTDNLGYVIKKCEPIPSCNLSTYINGLGSLPNQQITSPASPPLDFFVSCHSCSDQKIPTFARTLTALTDVTPNIKAGTFASFSIPSSDELIMKPYAKTPFTGNATSCQNAGLGKSFVANCAVQEVVLNLALQAFDAASATNNPLCVACLPGYKATMKGSTYIVEACTKIEYCQTSAGSTFNKCTSCVKGYSLKYELASPDGLSNYETCVENPNKDTNCLIADISTTPSRCKLCAAGYIINRDGFCDAVNTYSCTRPGFYSPFTKKGIRSLSFPYTGCAQCESDKIAIAFDSKKKICVMNNQVVFKTLPVSSNFIITNCQFYTVDALNNVVCQSCELGYILSVSATQCLKANTQLKNCDAYTSDGLKCGRCKNGFYPNQVSACVAGSILNCLTYSSETNCKVCMDGYIEIQAKGGRTICIVKPKVSCQAFSPASLALGVLSCSLCDANFFYSKNTTQIGKLPLTLCSPIPEVPNCVRYQNQLDIQTATMACQACKDEYYLNGNSCKLRTKPSIENCLKMSEVSDKCQSCDEKYTLDVTGNCLPFPSGIVNCESYKDKKTCLVCRPGAFLTENRCLTIPTEALIKNCLYYNAQLTCARCETGFYSTSPSICEVAIAKNCLKYESSTVCSTCPPTFGMVTDKNVTSCVAITISNCIQPNYSYGGPNFKCKICTTSFYLAEDQTCVAVINIIDHCALYSNSNTCSLCFDGYVLSQDSKSCSNDSFVLAQADPNCLNSYILPAPACNVCKERFYFQKNATVFSFDCTSCDASLAKGCVMCDVSDYSKCILCGSGYYQKEDGSCEISEQAPSLIVLSTDSGTQSLLFRAVIIGILIIINF